MNDILGRLSSIGIVPVVILNSAERAVALAEALLAGGIPAAEVTFRTPAAREAIAAIAREVPDVLLGAGTVTSVELAQQAVEAGAKYIVSPGLNPEVVSWCTGHGIPVLPGVATPTEVEAAMALGLTTLKFFPAEQNGGIAMLEALASPYRAVKFIPTGGVGKDNLCAYLALPNVAACGGSWIVPEHLIDAGDFAAITALCREAVRTMHGFSLCHVGLNSADATEAEQNVRLFAALFDLPVSELPNAYFAGDIVEVVKKPFLGAHGHIAIACNSMERALAYFAARGITFREEGIGRDEHGIVAIYFTQEIGGFAVHLRRKP